MLSLVTAFLQHYIEYLLPPYDWTTTAICLTLGCLGLFLECRTQNTDIPGCCRLGIRRSSNLENQDTSIARGPKVAALFVYPVKSCMGVQLQRSTVTATGLEHDRLFTFAQFVPVPEESGANGSGQWRFLTQRECPKLARLRTELWVPQRSKQRGSGPDESVSSQDDWRSNGGCVVIHFSVENYTKWPICQTETATIEIPLKPTVQRRQTKKYSYEQLSIWRDCPQSINITNELDKNVRPKLALFLGLQHPIGLFRVDDDSLRNITRSLPKEEPWSDTRFYVGFADAFPIHLIGLSSVRAVQEELPPKSEMREVLDARRFRANIYVSGTSAYEEDAWMKIRSGVTYTRNGLTKQQAEYHVACRTARCHMTNVHPESGVMNRSEPHATLKQTRQVDEGAKPHPCLGLSMMPLFSTGRIQVDDSIYIDREGEHYYEKMFN